MIRLRNQVPQVYSNASRDFQYLGWLIDIVLNSVKHNVDDMYQLPDNKADSRLTELLAMTLGFKVKRNYDKEQLAALVSIIPSILKYKGSMKAINLAGNALIKAAGSTGIFKCNLVNNCLEILLPKDLIDTILFMDLLPYILPAGLTCKIVSDTQSSEGIDPVIVNYHDVLLASWQPTLTWNDETQSLSGLSEFFRAGEDTPTYTNYRNSAGEELVLNTGLLDNTIIPDLPNTITTGESEVNTYGTTAIINDFTTEENEYGTTVTIEND